MRHKLKIIYLLFLGVGMLFSTPSAFSATATKTTSATSTSPTATTTTIAAASPAATATTTTKKSISSFSSRKINSVTKKTVSRGTAQFGIMAELDQNLNLVSHNDGNDQSSLDYGVYPSVAFKDILKLKFGLEGTQNHKDYEKSQLNSAFVGVSAYPYTVGNSLDLIPSLNTSFPVNKDQNDRQSLQWGNTFGLALALNEQVLPKDLSAGLMFLFGKYFYKYTTSTAGVVNIDYANRQVLFANYKISKWFYISGELMHSSVANFEDRISESFNGKQELGVLFDQAWTAVFGHTNGGNILKDDGRTSNVSLVNENSSVVYFGIRASY